MNVQVPAFRRFIGETAAQVPPVTENEVPAKPVTVTLSSGTPEFLLSTVTVWTDNVLDIFWGTVPKLVPVDVTAGGV
jgi:hypothetical protein